jgi:hypothetical protein
MEMIMKIVSFVKLDRFNEKLNDGSLILAGSCKDVKPLNIARNIIVRSTPLNEQMAGWSDEEKNKIALAVYSNSNFRFVLN